jgi:tRNA-dihydrouridine synthase B
MLDETNCDGLVIARGSFGNPWIFKEVKEFLKTRKILPKPAKDVVIKIMLEHLASSIDFYGERNGVVLFRKFFGWYTRGFRRIRPLREKSSRAKTRSEMEEIINRSSL